MSSVTIRISQARARQDGPDVLIELAGVEPVILDMVHNGVENETHLSIAQKSILHAAIEDQAITLSLLGLKDRVKFEW